MLSGRKMTKSNKALCKHLRRTSHRKLMLSLYHKVSSRFNKRIRKHGCYRTRKKLGVCLMWNGLLVVLNWSKKLLKTTIAVKVRKMCQSLVNKILQKVNWQPITLLKSDLCIKTSRFIPHNLKKQLQTKFKLLKKVMQLQIKIKL